MKTEIHAVNMTVVFVQEISRIYAQKPVDNNGRPKCVNIVIPYTDVNVCGAYIKARNSVIVAVGTQKYEVIANGKLNREQIVRAINEIMLIDAGVCDIQGDERLEIAKETIKK